MEIFFSKAEIEFKRCVLSHFLIISKWQKRKSRDEREINLYLRKMDFSLSQIRVKFATLTSDLRLAVLVFLQVNSASVFLFWFQ